MELKMDVRDKFDAILARVKETQSDLSLAELGLVEKLTYHEREKTIVAHMSFAPYDPSSCPACSVVDDMVKSSVERDLKEAILVDFPGWNVEFA